MSDKKSAVGGGWERKGGCLGIGCSFGMMIKVTKTFIPPPPPPPGGSCSTSRSMSSSPWR